MYLNMFLNTYLNGIISIGDIKETVEQGISLSPETI